MITIKQLDFPEIGQSLMGIGDRGIALLETALVSSLTSALAAALPHSKLIREQITTREIESFFQFSITDYGNLTSRQASNGLGCIPNSEDIDDAWEEWFAQTSEDVLLELLDHKRSAVWDPFQSHDSPSPDAINDYFTTYAANSLSAEELTSQLTTHPDTLLCAVLLKPEMEQTLTAFGYSACADNLRRVEEDIHFLFGRGNDHRTALYDTLVNRFDLLGLKVAFRAN